MWLAAALRANCLPVCPVGFNCVFVKRLPSAYTEHITLALERHELPDIFHWLVTILWMINVYSLLWQWFQMMLNSYTQLAILWRLPCRWYCIWMLFGWCGGVGGAPKLSQPYLAPHSKSASTPEVLGGPWNCRGKFEWHTMQRRSFGRKAHCPGGE